MSSILCLAALALLQVLNGSNVAGAAALLERPNLTPLAQLALRRADVVAVYGLGVGAGGEYATGNILNARPYRAHGLVAGYTATFSYSCVKTVQRKHVWTFRVFNILNPVSRYRSVQGAHWQVRDWIPKTIWGVRPHITALAHVGDEALLVQARYMTDWVCGNPSVTSSRPAPNYMTIVSFRRGHFASYVQVTSADGPLSVAAVEKLAERVDKRLQRAL